MDKIIIKRIEVYAFHGLFEEEKRLGQKFYVSAELDVDTEAAAAEDDLRLSVNYGEVSEFIVTWMQNNRFKLIETAADHLATAILKQYPLIKAIVIDLEKPNAPIPYALDTVMIHVERARHKAYLGIGSNIGERVDYIRTAITLLDEHPMITVVETSPVYETAPYGLTDQPPFLNGCIEIETFLSPLQLLRAINRIEAQLGRTREIHWGPRTMDLDILLYDQIVMDTKELHIPHIDMQNRLFVLKPLSDIAGFIRHPNLNKTIDELLKALQNQ